VDSEQQQLSSAAADVSKAEAAFSNKEREPSEPALGAQLSAILLASGKPLSVSVLAKATDEPVELVEGVLQNLLSLYKDEVHGFSLRQVAGGYQLRTAESCAEVIKRVLPPKAKKFSRAAAETLAVIAYKQPIQRAEIEAIRGVDALPTLKTLLDSKVIRAIGRDDEIGKPVLYVTTETFLERFGLNDLGELPTINELREFDSEPGEEGAETPQDQPPAQ
jgi:segregation and condensation protein B